MRQVIGGFTLRRTIGLAFATVILIVTASTAVTFYFINQSKAAIDNLSEMVEPLNNQSKAAIDNLAGTVETLNRVQKGSATLREFENGFNQINDNLRNLSYEIRSSERSVRDRQGRLIAALEKFDRQRAMLDEQIKAMVDDPAFHDAALTIHKKFGDFKNRVRDTHTKGMLSSNVLDENAPESDLSSDLPSIGIKLKEDVVDWSAHPKSGFAPGMAALHQAIDSGYEQIFGQIKKLSAEGAAQKADVARMDEKMREAKEASALPVTTSVILSIVVFIASIILTGITARQVSRPLKELAEDVRAVAAGDLSLEIVSFRKDEVGLLVKAFSTMIAEMNEVMHEAQYVVEKVQRSASMLSSSSRDVMTQMDDQATSVHQASAAVDNMRRQSEDIRDNATNAAGASDAASEHSNGGQRVVQQTIAEMQEVARSVSSSAEIINRLGEASRRIGDIVSTISEIADQTNLLALNAAIEAARAGDHGRGFAVVADEVRKLAEKVSKSASEIVELITTLQKEAKLAVSSMQQGAQVVGRGVQFANSAGSSLGNILQAVKRVDGLMDQTQAATIEQVDAAQDVSKTLARLKDLSLLTSNAAHDTSKEATEMEATITSLAQLLSHFRLGERTGSTRFNSLIRRAEQLRGETTRLNVALSNAEGKGKPNG